MTVTVFVLGTQLEAGAVTVTAGGAGAVTVDGTQLEAGAVETTVTEAVLGFWLIVVVAAVV